MKRMNCIPMYVSQLKGKRVKQNCHHDVRQYTKAELIEYAKSVLVKIHPEINVHEDLIVMGNKVMALLDGETVWVEYGRVEG